MEHYHVYLHNVPVVKDGKSVPIEPHRTQEFSELEEARELAAAHKDDYDRVVVMRTAEDGKQKMMERYIDGEYVVPEEKAEEAEEDEEDEEDEEADAE